MLKVYGGDNPHCLCCGMDIPEILCTDHIDNGGAKHRKELHGRSGYQLYEWMRKNNYPSGFQLLCHNCNYFKSVPQYKGRPCPCKVWLAKVEAAAEERGYNLRKAGMFEKIARAELLEKLRKGVEEKIEREDDQTRISRYGEGFNKALQEVLSLLEREKEDK